MSGAIQWSLALYRQLLDTVWQCYLIITLLVQLFVFPSNYAASSFKLRCANALTKNNGPYAAGAAIIHCLVVLFVAPLVIIYAASLV